jgi:hypothetical protein
MDFTDFGVATSRAELLGPDVDFTTTPSAQRNVDGSTHPSISATRVRARKCATSSPAGEAGVGKATPRDSRDGRNSREMLESAGADYLEAEGLQSAGLALAGDKSTHLSADLRALACALIRKHVEIDANGCWIWQRRRNRAGYGETRFLGGRYSSHRLSYVAHKGAIPAGLALDHLCRVTACCNPDHLEAVTCRENVLRGIGLAAVRSKQTHCIHGHEFTRENTAVRLDGRRNCKACARDRHSARYQRELAAREAARHAR